MSPNKPVPSSVLHCPLDVHQQMRHLPWLHPQIQGLPRGLGALTPAGMCFCVSSFLLVSSPPMSAWGPSAHPRHHLACEIPAHPSPHCPRPRVESSLRMDEVVPPLRAQHSAGRKARVPSHARFPPSTPHFTWDLHTWARTWGPGAMRGLCWLVLYPCAERGVSPEHPGGRKGLAPPASDQVTHRSPYPG